MVKKVVKYLMLISKVPSFNAFTFFQDHISKEYSDIIASITECLTIIKYKCLK